MADHGTLVLVTPPSGTEITGYQASNTGIDYPTPLVMATLPSPVLVGAYNIGGTLPCPPSGPTVPTTGQIWPRGNP